MNHSHASVDLSKLTDVKLCVSGAADTGHCGPDAYENAKELGREIARQGGTLLTGATTGFPLWAAMGVKEVGGFSIGVSPAKNVEEHMHVYRLPRDHMDVILYTGFGYSGRDLILTNSADAVFFGCGRIGTIHEFTVAFEEGKPMGVLRGGWGTDEVMQMILDHSNRPHQKIIFDDDPKRLVERVMLLVLTDRNLLLKSYDGFVPRPNEIVG